MLYSSSCLFPSLYSSLHVSVCNIVFSSVIPCFQLLFIYLTIPVLFPYCMPFLLFLCNGIEDSCLLGRNLSYLTLEDYSGDTCF